MSLLLIKTSGPWLDTARTNASFVVFVIVPILSAVVLVPRFVDPQIVEDIRSNFQVILLSKLYCTLHADECRRLLDPGFGNPRWLRRKNFDHYEMTYVRFFGFEYLENTLLQVLSTWPIKSVITAIIQNTYGPFSWAMFLEAVHVLVAVVSSMTFYTVTGAVTCEMSVFLILGVILTALEPWSAIVRAVQLAFGNTRTSVF